MCTRREGLRRAALLAMAPAVVPAVVPALALALAPTGLAHAQGAGPSSAAATAPVPPPELAAAIDGIRLQGQGRLRFLGLRVYDAKLWVGAQPVVDAWADLPFALELDYARELPGKRIAERSLVEMKRQGNIAQDIAAAWLEVMQQVFPDVKAGDRLSALNVPGKGLRFFFNGQLRAEPRDLDFARVFFGIWFSSSTSEPQLRLALLGRSPS
jgi:hypothetical protein